MCAWQAIVTTVTLPPQLLQLSRVMLSALLLLLSSRKLLAIEVGRRGVQGSKRVALKYSGKCPTAGAKTERGDKCLLRKARH